MNSVETPMMQLMQAVSATSPQSAAALFVTQDAASGEQQNYSMLFDGYLQSAEGGAAASSATGIFSLSKASPQPYSAAPEDATIAVNPVDAALRPLGLGGLIAGEDAQALLGALLGQASLQDAAQTGEPLDSFALAIDYRALQQNVELTTANLQALQAALPENYAKLQDTSLAQQAMSANSTSAAFETSAQSGHMLPANDLLFLFGENAQMPAGLNGNSAGIMFNGAQDAPMGTQAATTQSASSAATPALALAAGQVAAADTAAAAAAEPVVKDAMAPPPQTLSVDGNAEKGLMQDMAKGGVKVPDQQAPITDPTAKADAKAEADGQILAVEQKKMAANKPGAATVNTTTATDITHQMAAASAQTSARPALSPTQTSSRDGIGEKSAPLASTEQPTAAAIKQAPVVTAPARPVAAPTIDWSSPWSTPERAAGWPEGFSTGLIASGLNGLSGQNNPLGGMGLMGGRPDPAMGQHVAKQLNLNITRAVKAGDNQFAMRMDPPELGRVSVKLTFLQNGLVKSQIMAERPETLELLQRDMRSLERAIEAGGHKAEPGGISFSLDSGGQESAGRAFAEAMQEDQLKDQQAKQSGGDMDMDGDMMEVADNINLDEILAHVTPETGLDVRV